MMALLRRWLGIGELPPTNGSWARQEEWWTEEFKAAISTIRQADSHSAQTQRVATRISDPAAAIRNAQRRIEHGR